MARFASIGQLRYRRDVSENPVVSGDTTTYHLVFLPGDTRGVFYNEHGLYPLAKIGGDDWRIISADKAPLTGEENCSLPDLLRMALTFLARADNATVKYHAWMDYLQDIGKGSIPIVHIAVEVKGIGNRAAYGNNLLRKLDRWAWQEETALIEMG